MPTTPMLTTPMLGTPMPTTPMLRTLSAMAADVEAILRGARRPLIIGMGGGGDVVGALATAESMRLLDGAEPLVGGVTWERRPIDPAAGPRRSEEVEQARELADGVMLAGPTTRVRGSEVYFAESRMAAYLDRPTLLIDVNRGAPSVASGLWQAIDELERDLTVFVDVGGDVLARGDELGLRSPLCDSVMLAAAALLGRRGHPVLLGVFGIGCDAELTPDEVLERLSLVAAADGLCGARGLTEPVARSLEGSLELVPTEASAQAVRAFRGVSGEVRIRGGERRLELSPLAALTYYLDVEATLASAGGLARLVIDAPDLEHANDALHAAGVRTELDLERRAAGEPGWEAPRD
ncbi:MAG: DUF1152 domain-containing protein [Solirubrobacteraceae bacterium]